MSLPHNNSSSTFLMSNHVIFKICGWFAIFLMIFLASVQYVEFYQISSSTKIRESEKQVRFKTILYWTSMFDDKHFYFGDGNVFENCFASACNATHERDFMDIEDYDAILFHGIEVDPSDLPASRSRNQKYIFVDLESPANQKLDGGLVPDGFYNWTMTYRMDSDIPRPYGVIVDRRSNDVVFPAAARRRNFDAVREAHADISEEKSNDLETGGRRAVAWIVSRCSTVGKRDRYVNELRKYIDVDIYGKCGRKCPPGKNKCHEMLESRYHFYLSFENSLCEDYVTEKLYKSMKYNMVPVVYGGANYTLFAPAHSYINVADFASPKHLAMYLKLLMKNTDEYRKYFWWKKFYKLGDNHEFTLCKLCEMLHKKNVPSKRIMRLNDWWTKDKCYNPAEFIKKIT